jgi:predicted RNase H-like nuclease
LIIGPEEAVLGVDGWQGAWVAALISGRHVSWRCGRFADLLSADLAVVAVDIPIGLPARGRRSCDLAARAALGAARSRAFPVPPRAAYEQATMAEANQYLRAASEPAISAQTWGLRQAVLEVDAHADDGRIVEVHPELSFAAMAGRILPPKKTARGVAGRIAALSGWIPEDELLAALADAPERVPVDDALDALAAAWSARRVQTGRALRYLAADAPTDEYGRPMVIHA